MRCPVSIQILCASVNGIQNKIDELHLRIEDYEPYVLLRVLSKSTVGGVSTFIFYSWGLLYPYLNFDPVWAGMGASGKQGIVTMARNDLNSTEISFPGIFQKSLWLKMKLGNHDTLLIGAAYRSSSSDGCHSAEALCYLLLTDRGLR